MRAQCAPNITYVRNNHTVSQPHPTHAHKCILVSCTQYVGPVSIGRTCECKTHLHKRLSQHMADLLCIRPNRRVGHHRCTHCIWSCTVQHACACCLAVCIFVKGGESEKWRKAEDNACASIVNVVCVHVHVCVCVCVCVCMCVYMCACVRQFVSK